MGELMSYQLWQYKRAGQSWTEDLHLLPPLHWQLHAVLCDVFMNISGVCSPDADGTPEVCFSEKPDQLLPLVLKHQLDWNQWPLAFRWGPRPPFQEHRLSAWVRGRCQRGGAACCMPWRTAVESCQAWITTPPICVNKPHLPQTALDDAHHTVPINNLSHARTYPPSQRLNSATWQESKHKWWKTA